VDATVNAVSPEDLDTVIARYAVGRVTDASSLAQAGLDSLAVLRIVVESVTDPEIEIAPSRLADVLTVADLKRWLGELHDSTELVPADER
jgi:acyl carrier protein